MTEHKIGTQEEWAAARAALLAREKEHTRLGDELARQRRALPWVRVEKEYTLQTVAPPFAPNSGFAQTPALIMDGDFDLVPVGDVKAIFKRFPKGHFVEVANAGHFTGVWSPCHDTPTPVEPLQTPADRDGGGVPCYTLHSGAVAGWSAGRARDQGRRQLDPQRLDQLPGNHS